MSAVCRVRIRAELLASEFALRGFAFGPVHQQAVIVGEPGQLSVLWLNPSDIHQLRVPVLEDHLGFVDIILGMVRGAGPGAIRGRLDDVHLAVGKGVIERGIVARVAQKGLQFLGS